MLGFCQILTWFITRSRQQESSFLRRQSLFLMCLIIPRLSSPTFSFTFQQHPWQPDPLDQREHIHFSPEYSPVRAPWILVPDCRGPSSGASPLTMQRKDIPPTEAKMPLKQHGFIQNHQQKKENTVEPAILKPDLIKPRGEE